jgi:hypothetical protein
MRSASSPRQRGRTRVGVGTVRLPTSAPRAWQLCSPTPCQTRFPNLGRVGRKSGIRPLVARGEGSASSPAAKAKGALTTRCASLSGPSGRTVRQGFATTALTPGPRWRVGAVVMTCGDAAARRPAASRRRWPPVVAVRRGRPGCYGASRRVAGPKSEEKSARPGLEARGGRRKSVAIYHLTTKPLPRSAGRCAPAAAAYRTASKVRDEITGQTFDYTRKRGVEHTEIVLSTKAAKQDVNWARDRHALWNAAEKAEKRKDARTAREYIVALPHELARKDRIELARQFSSELANRYNVAVDFAVHKPHREGDERNYHAHLLVTTREITPAGLGEKTAIELSNTKRISLGLKPAADEIKEIRARWESLTNEMLKERGHDARIDHRSLAAQGIDRAPTVHLGPTVSGMERRGVRTLVGDRIREQRTLDAQARLERAAELGRLERESKQIQESILVLSTDITAARAARDATPEREQSIAERQQTAAERWAAKYETPSVGTGQTQERAPSKDRGIEQTHDAEQSKELDRNKSADDDFDHSP